MSGIDQRGKLEDEPFSFQVTKDGRVRIAYNGRVVTTLHGKSAEKFLSRAADCTTQEAQLLMAKATGNFKRGNERESKKKPRIALHLSPPEYEISFVKRESQQILLSSMACGR